MASELYRLLCFGSYEEVKSFVKKNPLSVREQCPDSGKLPHHHILSPIMEEWDDIDLDIPENHRIMNRKEKLGLLIEVYPEGLTTKDCKGRIPLHMAAMVDEDRELDESLELLAFTLNANPAASQIGDSDDQTPLEFSIEIGNFEHAQILLENHWGTLPPINQTSNDREPIIFQALDNGAPIKFFRALMKKIHQCAQIVDDSGDLPLHRCLYRGLPIETVKLVMDAYPIASYCPDSYGRYPLSLELMVEARLDVVRLLLQKYPDAVILADNNDLLPMHHAVSSNNITNEVLELLKKHNPCALTTVLSNGNTLLHHALPRFPFSISEVAIRWLVKYCPISLRSVNDNLEYPLHCATCMRFSCFPWLDVGPAIVRLLVEQFPAAVRFPDNDGRLPLHNAIQNKAPQNIIELLLEKFPDSIHHATAEGNFPLHVACGSASSSKTLDFLIKKYPNALKEYNEEGLLPFHQACLHRESYLCWESHYSKNLELLIKRMSLPTLPLTKSGVHPLFLACQNDKSLDIIWKLVQHSPELFRRETSLEIHEKSPRKRQRISN